jgi:hypothetical protein
MRLWAQVLEVWSEVHKWRIISYWLSDCWPLNTERVA